MIVDGAADFVIGGSTGAVVDIYVLELWYNYCTEILIITGWTSTERDARRRIEKEDT